MSVYKYKMYLYEWSRYIFGRILHLHLQPTQLHLYHTYDLHDPHR